MANHEAVALLGAMLVEDGVAFDDQAVRSELARLTAADRQGTVSVIAAAFLGACQRRFGSDPDPSAIAQSVAAACQASGADPTTAETLVWATFRHEERADQLDPDDVLAVELILIRSLIAEAKLSPEQIEQFLMYVVMLVDQAG